MLEATDTISLADELPAAKISDEQHWTEKLLLHRL